MRRHGPGGGGAAATAAAVAAAAALQRRGAAVWCAGAAVAVALVFVVSVGLRGPDRAAPGLGVWLGAAASGARVGRGHCKSGKVVHEYASRPYVSLGAGASHNGLRPHN